MQRIIQSYLYSIHQRASFLKKETLFQKLCCDKRGGVGWGGSEKQMRIAYLMFFT